ncbi:CHAT domain-containing protein [Planctomycetota bacterium]
MTESSGRWNLDLRQTELIVLATCQSAAGVDFGSSGVLGLQKAIHIAGARTTVATLWPITDAVAEAVFTEFYRNMWNQKMSKAEALQKAISTTIWHYDLKENALGDLRRDEPLPAVLWAPFVLSGDWR